jgi:hypothetical protein
MVETRVSQRAGMRMLREAGFRFSDVTFRTIYNTFQLAQVLSPGLQRVSLELLPGARQIVPLPDILKLYRGNFAYLFDVTLRNVLTGEIRIVRRKITRDTLISLAAATRLLDELLESLRERYPDQEVVERKPVVVYARQELYRELLE